ncbi:MAG: SIS domain-containing protein [Planctomycetes bacterium]|nr:SIS domain-containing protein [Planctomycetota bacterium]
MAAALERFAAEHPQLAALRDELARAVALVVDCARRGGTVMTCGNGGSAADADHIVGELMKGFRDPRRIANAESAALIALDPRWRELAPKLQRGIRAQSLCAHPGLVTAIANDNHPELVFAQQVHAIAGPADVLIALTTSGASANVLRAAEVARTRGCRVIAFTGSRPCPLARLADIWLAAPAVETYRVQEYHLPLYHALCYLAEQALFGTPDAANHGALEAPEAVSTLPN